MGRFYPQGAPATMSSGVPQQAHKPVAYPLSSSLGALPGDPERDSWLVSVRPMCVNLEKTAQCGQIPSLFGFVALWPGIPCRSRTRNIPEARDVPVLGAQMCKVARSMPSDPSIEGSLRTVLDAARAIHRERFRPPRFVLYATGDQLVVDASPYTLFQDARVRVIERNPQRVARTSRQQPAATNFGLVHQTRLRPLGRARRDPILLRSSADWTLRNIPESPRIGGPICAVSTIRCIGHVPG